MAIDIDQSHFNTGTASVAANGTVVTFQGAPAIATVVRRNDIFGTHVGSGVRMSELGPGDGLTANQARLAYPWRGPAQTAAAYEIQRTPYDIGYLAAIQELIETYGIGMLPALAALDGTGGDKLIKLTGPGAAAAFDGKNIIAEAALVGAANKISYYTGAGAKALADFPLFARTLLGGTNQAAALGTLGLLPVQSSALDVSTNRLARSDAFGLGPGFVDVPDLAVADTSMNRFFRVTGSAANGPGFQAAVIASVFNATTTCFLAIGVDGRLSVGVKTSPTGAPVWTPTEGTRGSNANGEWVRFPDGTQICWITSLAMTRNSATTLQGAWPLPVQFLNSNIQIDFIENALPAATVRESALWATSTATTATLRIVQNGTWPDPTNITVQAKATGRWK